MTDQTGPTNDQNEHRSDPRNDNDLFTLDEVADILRTPVATLRYWRHLGTGPHSFKIGRRVVYQAGDIYTWLNAQHDHHGPTAA